MSDTVSFRAVQKRLEANGWSLIRTSGSHHIFQGPDRDTVVIPVHKNKCKRVYDREADKAIEKYRRSSKPD